MYKNRYWQPAKSGCYLEAGGYIGVRMQMNRWIATSFDIMVEKQCSIDATEKLACAYMHGLRTILVHI